MADGRPYCPVDDENVLSEVRITGLEVAPVSTGAEIRFATAGSRVESYRVYRGGRSGESSVLVAQGPAMSERLIRVMDPVPPAAVYVVEVVDSFGQVTRVVLPAGSSQIAEIAASRTVVKAEGG